MANKLMTWNSPYSLLLDHGEYSVNRSLNLKHPRGLVRKQPLRKLFPTLNLALSPKISGLRSQSPTACTHHQNPTPIFYWAGARAHTHTDTHMHRAYKFTRARTYVRCSCRSPTHGEFTHSQVHCPQNHLRVRLLLPLSWSELSLGADLRLLQRSPKERSAHHFTHLVPI